MIRKLLLRFPNFPGARWAISAFVVLSTKEAEELGLMQCSNLYDCRSFWVDRQGRRYRVRELAQMATPAHQKTAIIYDDKDDYYYS